MNQTPFQNLLEKIQQNFNKSGAIEFEPMTGPPSIMYPVNPGSNLLQNALLNDPKYKNVSLANFLTIEKSTGKQNQTKIQAKAILKNYFNQELKFGYPNYQIKGCGITIIGAEGLGKTHLLISLARHFIKHETRLKTFIVKFSDIWQYKPAEIDYIITRLTNVKRLMLDDFLRGVLPYDRMKRGQEIDYPFQIFRLIDAFYTRKQRLFISCNYTIDQIGEFLGPEYGPFVTGRLLEMNRMPVVIEGESWRS